MIGIYIHIMERGIKGVRLRPDPERSDGEGSINNPKGG